MVKYVVLCTLTAMRPFGIGAGVLFMILRTLDDNDHQLASILQCL